MKYPGLSKTMKEKKETATELSKLLKLPKSSFSRRIHGQLEFRINEIFTIMDHYNMSFEELFK